jgi:hypothetical protein
LVSFKSNTLEVVCRVLIGGYNWKEKVIIALETESDTHFETEGVLDILNQSSTWFFQLTRPIKEPKEKYVEWVRLAEQVTIHTLNWFTLYNPK